MIDLPKDSRTLLKTPREMSNIIMIIEPGEYLHLGVKKGICRTLARALLLVIPEILLIDFNTDGMTLDKSGNIQLWPIQIRVANIYDSKS